MNHQQIAQVVIAYAKTHGRFHLPWKINPTPYRVWVSEVMLQQTQVQTVIDYFENFMQLFPTVEDLAKAHIDEVLSAWAGLGYYRRAHHLHECAKKVCKTYQGEFPKTVKELMTLKGIGRSTAGAVLAQGYHISAPILDGNVKRVLMRFYGLEGYPEQPQIIKQLWTLSESITPLENVAEYTQGIMDLGANICTKYQPSCEQCPLVTNCVSHQQNNQHLIPASKPKVKKPTKRCLFGIIFNEKEEILLLKRPDRGIWSGLWSLPSIQCSKDLNLFKQHALKGVAHPLHLGKKRKHAFTHFNLEYKPVIMRQTHPFGFKGVAVKWLYPERALELGLPAPIKKLLEGNFL